MEAKSRRGAKADTTKKRRTREMNMAVTGAGPSLSLLLDDMWSVVVVVVCRNALHDDDDVS